MAAVAVVSLSVANGGAGGRHAPGARRPARLTPPRPGPAPGRHPDRPDLSWTDLDRRGPGARGKQVVPVPLPRPRGAHVAASHTVWESKAHFEGWTKSEQFRASHTRASTDSNKPLTLGHPEFEGFEVFQTVRNASHAGR